MKNWLLKKNTIAYYFIPTKDKFGVNSQVGNLVITVGWGIIKLIQEATLCDPPRPLQVDSNPPHHTGTGLHPPDGRRSCKHQLWPTTVQPTAAGAWISLVLLLWWFSSNMSLWRCAVTILPTGPLFCLATILILNNETGEKWKAS